MVNYLTTPNNSCHFHFQCLSQSTCSIREELPVKLHYQLELSVVEESKSLSSSLKQLFCLKRIATGKVFLIVCLLKQYLNTKIFIERVSDLCNCIFFSTLIKSQSFQCIIPALCFAGQHFMVELQWRDSNTMSEFCTKKVCNLGRCPFALSNSDCEGLMYIFAQRTTV